jgi:small subunit ribosomal protein S18
VASVAAAGVPAARHPRVAAAAPAATTRGAAPRHRGRSAAATTSLPSDFVKTFCTNRTKEKDMAKSTKRRPAPEKPVKARKCVFCSKKGQDIDYKDTQLLRTYISERGKIRARRVTGNCVQHQRDIAIAVKNAREVALLPFISSTR